jgi:hypothetical protein
MAATRVRDERANWTLVVRASRGHTVREGSTLTSDIEDLGRVMTLLTYAAVSDALDLIGTPLALEVLGDLAAGRAPDARGEDRQTMAAAFDRLTGIGAATTPQQDSEPGSGRIEITPQGKELYWRLVEIEQMAEQLSSAHQTA